MKDEPEAEVLAADGGQRYPSVRSLTDLIHMLNDGAFNAVTSDDLRPLSIPNLFMICIPIFARSPDFYRLLARLRYRKTAGGLTFWYEMWRADMAFEQAFNDACDKVRIDTGLPLFVGQPEAAGQ